MTSQNSTQTQALGGIVDQQVTIPQPTSASDPKPSMPQMNFTTRKKPRSGVSSDCKQLVVLNNDVSSSMSGQKIQESDQANQELATILAAPENRNGFYLASVHFNDSAQTALKPELATTAVLPPLVAGGGTNFDAALKKALEVVSEFMSRDNPEGWDFLRPHVLYLSDGHSSASQQNIDALHEVADVTVIAYGADADEATLSRIASDGKVHMVGTNGGELRAFLAQVGQTLSQKFATAR
jgi:uncharacterized protein YegL